MSKKNQASKVKDVIEKTIEGEEDFDETLEEDFDETLDDDKPKDEPKKKVEKVKVPGKYKKFQ
jgi:predicted DNA-binding protein